MDDEEAAQEARAGRARGRERQVGVRRFELRPVEAGGRRLPAQARALRVVQGAGAQAGEAQEDEGPERLHPTRRRTADQRARLHLFLPARADRAGDRHDVRPGGQDRSTRWSSTRSPGACGSTTRRSCRPATRDRRRRPTGDAMRRRTAGFTLLEIMVAVAILATTLVVLLEIVTNNVRATNHAKLTTAATFLARTKMSDIEDDILYDGFSSETENAKGTFKARRLPAVPLGDQHRTHRAAHRHDAADAGRRRRPPARNSKDPMAMMTGFLGGMMSTLHRADPDRAAGVGAQGDGARVLGRERAPQSDRSRWFST